MIYLTPQELTLDAAPAGELPRRTLAGVAVKYDVDATVSDGQKVRFAPGSLPLAGKKPKMYLYHDASKPVGVVESRVEVGDSVLFEARISETALGNEALTLAADGVLDAVSVGVNPTRFSYDGDVMVIEAAEWQELSLVPFGAVPGAVVERVAATIPQNEPEVSNNEQENPSEETTPMEQHTEQPAVIEAQPITTTVYAQPRNFALPSVSEYMAAYFRGGHDFAQLNANIKAAAPNVVTGDTPGILPEVIVTPVYDSLNPIRPFVSAIGTRAMPQMGATFRRPVITTRPVVTEQPTGQNTTLDPSTVVISNNDISKKTFGTYVTMSEQDLDWTDPASLNIVLEQLAIAYGQATDNYAIDTCHAAITQTASVADTSVGADWVAAIYDGARQISASSNYLPTHMFVTPASWAALASSTDDQNRPVFPFVGAPGLNGQNAAGTSAATSWNGNPLGLVLVVDKHAPGSFMGHAAGPAAGFEFYETPKGAVSIDEPSKLARTIAWRGYAAAFMADATKFVKFV
jgi:hypothetical protein